jgi:hypothetical protein
MIPAKGRGILITPEQTAHLGRAAGQTLEAFEKISTAAKSRLAQATGDPGDALAVRNSFTDSEAIGNLSDLARAEREACQRLAREPAIARVVVANEDGDLDTYYVSRAASPTGGALKVASYRSPLGRLAALEPGDTLNIAKGGSELVVEVVERALLKPEQDRDGWDAPNTLFETEAFGPVTVESLRRLLQGSDDLQETIDEIDRMLQEEQAAVEIVQGRRRSIIERMGLRDQPVLDKLQDEIFRMPINSRLAVLGAPGSGKTTTLIRRLGQKLDDAALEAKERQLIRRAALTGSEPHERSWLMFTPTELLRGYVKEAFNREGIAAPDSRIRTWDVHRRDIARGTVAILRSSSSTGTWIVRENEPTLLDTTLSASTEWFKDFEDWQRHRFWSDLQAATEALSAGGDPRADQLAERITATLSRFEGDARRLLAAIEFVPEIRTLLEELAKVVATELRATLNDRIREDRGFLDSLAGFIDTLGDPVDDDDVDGEAEADTEGDEDENEAPPQTRRGVAIATFNSVLRRQAVAHISGRRTTRGRTAALLGWLGERGLGPDRIEAVGRNLLAQRGLRRLASPVNGYVGGVARRYRAFRRVRRGEGHWYGDHAIGRVANVHEIDVMILATLRAVNDLLAEERVRRELDTPVFALLKRVSLAQRNQILVDEVTDFSPIQLACMAALANPFLGSVFVCGDFNQRITTWGLRTPEDLRWAVPGVNERKVVVAYRQTRQLYEFARTLAQLSGEQPTEAALPVNVDTEGVPPALGCGLSDNQAISDWLAARIAEIGTAVGSMGNLPTIAVLVSDEAQVQPIAAALDAALAETNLRAVPCPAGQVVGNDLDVRVFDVQHVKGMEFEGVFFVGIDSLAESHPDLFDKYLYVGTTRAASYLGVTCAGQLPDGLAGVRGSFCERW